MQGIVYYFIVVTLALLIRAAAICYLSMILCFWAFSLFFDLDLARDGTSYTPSKTFSYLKGKLWTH
jgi:hypothetical protein